MAGVSGHNAGNCQFNINVIPCTFQSFVIRSRYLPAETRVWKLVCREERVASQSYRLRAGL